MPKESTQFKKGGKPGPGRPPGFRGVARMIMKETRDGAELVEFALRVLRDEGEDHDNRWAALQWLADRGLGKPLVSVDLAAEVGVHDGAALPAIDLSALSVEALKQLDAALDAVEDEAVAEIMAPPDGPGDADGSN